MLEALAQYGACLRGGTGGCVASSRRRALTARASSNAERSLRAVFRLCSLWFEAALLPAARDDGERWRRTAALTAASSSANRLMAELATRVPASAFLPLFYQLASRIATTDDAFQVRLAPAPRSALL